MFGSNNGIFIALLVLDMVVTIGIVFFILSRRASKGGTNRDTTSNVSGDFNSAPSSPFESPFNSSTTSNTSDGDDIKELLRRGQKIEAIKRYRERNPASGLKDAKDAVEEIERGGDFNSLPSSPIESPFNSTVTPDGEDIKDLLKRGQKLEAIKLYRERTGIGLKEAKDAVEAIERQMN